MIATSRAHHGSSLQGEGEEKIDPEAILPRRTRGNVVDYTSEAALHKAGLTATDLEEDPDASMDAPR